jgi:hypothetical protein
LGEAFAIRGASVSNDEHAKFPVDTVGGTIDFIPTVFKYTRSVPVAVVGSVGTPPSTPSVSVAAGGSAATPATPFQVGEVYSYRVQAVNVAGMSTASASQSVTVTTAGATYTLTITNDPTVEYYMVFRSPVESSGLAGTEMYCGRIIPSGASGTTLFLDVNSLVPGLDSILFLPRDKNRAKLATLGNLLNKLQLGVKGTAFETIYASYFGCIVDRPRTFAIADNLYQQREGI